MLASISRILHIRLPQQLRGGQQVCSAHVPVLLLAGYEQRHGQPHHLLLDEQQVPKIYQLQT